MLINFDPTITGGFVHSVMRDSQVSDKFREANILSEETQHNIVKSILIAGFRDYEVDINKIISATKRKSVTQEQ